MPECSQYVFVLSVRLTFTCRADQCTMARNVHISRYSLNDAGYQNAYGIRPPL